jgi:GT2 family glycosyltransferase
MKKVSIIIVNWNGLHHLKKCLPTLKKITYPNYEIILVDNASTKDKSVEYVKKYYPEIKLVVNKENLGFAGGNNVGFKIATGDYILFLNNDTQVMRDFLNKLVKKLEESDHIGGVQSKIRSMIYNHKLDSVGAFLTNTGFLYHLGYLQRDLKKYDSVTNLYTAKGACMLFRKKVIDKVGLFDNNFFAYFEETDFCHRVWLAGYTIQYAPKSIIYHQIGGTSNNMPNAFIQFHSFKNRINSYLKNLGTAELLMILPTHIILCEIAALGFIFRRRPDLFVAINRAFYWNMQNWNQTMRERNKIQTKIRKVSDRTIMPLLKRSAPFKYYYYLFTNNLQSYKP